MQRGGVAAALAVTDHIGEAIAGGVAHGQCLEAAAGGVDGVGVAAIGLERERAVGADNLGAGAARGDAGERGRGRGLRQGFGAGASGADAERVGGVGIGVIGEHTEARAAHTGGTADAGGVDAHSGGVVEGHRRVIHAGDLDGQRGGV